MWKSVSFALLGIATVACAPAKTGSSPASLTRDQIETARRIDDAIVSQERACATDRTLGPSVDDVVRTLGLADCSTEVYESTLRSCLSSIHELPCGASVDSVSQIATCRVGSVCGEIEEGTM